jgi:CheY-like chemotaxis protein
LVIWLRIVNRHAAFRIEVELLSDGKQGANSGQRDQAWTSVHLVLEVSPTDADWGQRDMPSRILLVDDENSVRDSLYELLESNGYEVLAASNGPDGLTIFRQSARPIELLVTDYNMPQMSGLELARECLLLHRELRVLYVSGSRPDAELQADLQAPNRGFLAKPFRGNDLLRKARALLPVESTRLSLEC